MTAEVECTCPECGAEFSAKPEGGHRLLCSETIGMAAEAFEGTITDLYMPKSGGRSNG